MPTNGYKMTEVGEIPVDWDLESIGNLGNIITGKTPSTKVREYYNGDVPFVTPVDLGHKKYIHDSINKMSKLGFEQSPKLPPNSIMVTCIGELGKVGMAKRELATNQQINTVICKEDKIKHEYFYYAISHFKYQLNIVAGLQVVPIVNKSTFSKLFVPIPPLPEQQKIGDILSTTDRTIEKTEALIEKLKSIKKGLMQDLLTCGIDENGNIKSEETHRFKDSELGRIPEEWEVNSFGNFFSLIYGDSLPNNKRSGHGYPVYGSNGIVGYHNEYLVEGVGIVVGRKGSIGSVTLANSSFWAIDTTYYVGFKKDVELYWAYYLMKFLNLHRLDSSTGIPGLNRNDVYETYIKIPQKPEQQRIANILSSMDERIQKEEAYRDKLLKTKKALMQDLLTGKVKVNTDGVEIRKNEYAEAEAKV